MGRYFLTLGYDGSRYHGWQVQPGAVTVQETVQDALSKLLRASVAVTGAGRTDAGVHARMMVAHFDWDAAIDCPQMVYKLNKILPPDIAAYECQAVAEGMHARFSASSRTYHYFVHTRKDPFLRSNSCLLYMKPDFEAMNRAARVIMEYEDFTSFSKLHTQVKTNICHITRAEWERVGEQQWRFTITADRFLRNMVRAVVGTLLMVGCGKLDEDGLRRIIEQKDRCKAGESVPAYALYLVDISY